MKIQQINRQKLIYQLPLGIAVVIAGIFFLRQGNTDSDTEIITGTEQISSILSCANPNEIGGRVFEDLNNDGIYQSEDGMTGVSVSLFDDHGQVGTTQLTDAAGGYLFTDLTVGASYRIEIMLPEGYGVGISGEDSKTTIQFTKAGTCDNDLGLVDIINYYDEDPYVIVPCYVNGEYNGALSNFAAIAKVLESADGHDFNAAAKTSDFEASKIASHLQVGSVYGIAWQPKRKRYYASSFHKRYVDYGPNGPDAIYQLDLEGNVIGVIELDNLLGSSNTAGADVHDFTEINGELYDLGTGDISFDAVGKRAFGDAELSDNDSTLFLVNLYDRKIYALDVSSGNVADVSILNSWSTPDATAANRHRPFGLAFHEGKLWVGSVDENASNAYVHSLDPAGTSFSLELSIPLGYDRQAYAGNTQSTGRLSNWNAWISSTTVDYMISNTHDKDIAYPQPILTDIEFAENGDMILGFRDRFGDQSGSDAIYRASDLSSPGRVYGVSAGDILKACYNNGNYVLETGTSGGCGGSIGTEGSSGPGGVEFYQWDIYTGNWQSPWDPNTYDKAFHWETAQGGLVRPKGKSYVISTHMNPFDDYAGGLIKHDNTTGKRVGIGNSNTADISALGGGYTLFDNGDYQTNGAPPSGGAAFGKANGLGDLEVASAAPEIEIGSYIWIDADGDGIQDPSEKPVEGLTVHLLDAARNILATAATGANGEVYFNTANVTQNGATGITYYSTYILQVPNTYGGTEQAVFSSHILSTANEGASDQIDSDAVWNGSNAEITISTDAFNGSDHSFDIGLTPGTFPVEWLSFEAIQVGNDAMIKWATASETNADYFDIERSLDGRAFQKVGTEGATGTTQEVSRYNFRDVGISDLLDKKLFYRLKQVDENGSFSYSKVLELRLNDETQFASILVYPNPVHDVMKITFKQAEPQLLPFEIITSLGRKVYAGQIREQEGELKIPVADWEEGSYFLKVEDQINIVTRFLVIHP